MGRVRSPKRRVRDDDFILGYRRIIVESSFYWRKHSGCLRWNLELQDFVAGAVFGEVGGWLYLLHALEMTFESDADHWWRSFCVAGAVFGEVGGWLDCLRALEMTVNMWRWSSTTFILRGRHSIWWVCRETLLAPRIGNDVSYVTQIIADLHFAWQAQYLVRLPGDFTLSAHWKWSFIVT